jgi:hypothetical protein
MTDKVPTTAIVVSKIFEVGKIVADRYVITSLRPIQDGVEGSYIDIRKRAIEGKFDGSKHEGLV